MGCCLASRGNGACLAIFSEGKNPWQLGAAAGGNGDSYSTRVFAFNVTESHIHIYFLVTYNLRISTQYMMTAILHTNCLCFLSPCDTTQVLADDTNQDMMRSLVTVFRPLRVFAAEYEP